MMNAPYYRFSPELSSDIPLDCTDDRILVEMCWETYVYMQENQGDVQEIVELLKIFSET